MESIITVTGTAMESTAPDQTELSLTLTVKNKDYSAMMTEASEKADALISALSGVGFSKSEVKTADFRISSDYDNVQTENGAWKRQFVGYSLTHRLHLAFPYDMNTLNDAVNAVTSCKKANPEISISFSVKDKEEIDRRLLAAAVKDAKSKAEIIAAAAGVTLGKICGINYGAPSPDPVSPTMYRQAKALTLCEGADLSINPENAENCLEITASWYIE